MPRAGKGNTAVEEATDTEILFPELDDSPEHKELIRKARKVAKLKSERENLLTTSKEKCDTAMESLIAGMHENKLTKFKHSGITVELIEGREKVEVKVEDDAAEESED